MHNHYSFLKEHQSKILIIIFALVALDGMLWWHIMQGSVRDKNLHLYFLDVGQGDSELVVFPGGAKLLIDGGPPNGKLLRALDRVLSPTDRRIDLVMMTHPQLDHFGGFVEAFKRYTIGAFIWTGRTGTISAFHDLENVLKDNVIRTVTLEKGDMIRYGESRGIILSPSDAMLGSKELNDTSLVMELRSASSTTLFTGDIGENIETLLKNETGAIDILKVPHHGSRFSSSANFLDALRPKVAVIEVGKNSYGHPTTQVLKNLQKSGARVLRTDESGTVELIINGEKVNIKRERQ